MAFKQQGKEPAKAPSLLILFISFTLGTAAFCFGSVKLEIETTDG